MKKKRIIATALTGLSLLGFGLTGCGEVNTQTDVTPQEPAKTESQADSELKTQLDELKGALDDLKKDLASAKQDITDLKAADKQLLALINSNMSSVTKSYNDLVKKVDELKKNHDNLAKDVTDLHTSHDTLAGEVDDLKSQYSALQTQYSALNDQLQTLSSSLSTLQGAVETLGQDSVTQDLAETIKKMQSKINQLIVENALNLTLGTRFNRITCDVGGRTFSASTNPNGEYVISSDNYTSLVKNGVRFESYNGQESAHYEGKPMINRVTSLVYPPDSVVTSSGSSYTITSTSSADRLSVDLDNNGYVAGFNSHSYSFGNVNVVYAYEITEPDYQNEYAYRASEISMVGYYDELSTAVDNTFDCNNVIVTATMTADAEGYSGDSKFVLAKDKSASYASAMENNEAFEGYAVLETVDGVYGGTVANVDTDGTIKTEESKAKITPQYLGESLKFSLFNSNFTITYDSESETYTISVPEYKQSVSMKIEKNGISEFTLTLRITNDKEQTVTETSHYTIATNVDKATFDREFDEIKAKLEEVLSPNADLSV